MPQIKLINYCFILQIDPRHWLHGCMDLLHLSRYSSVKCLSRVTLFLTILFPSNWAFGFTPHWTPYFSWYWATALQFYQMLWLKLHSHPSPSDVLFIVYPWPWYFDLFILSNDDQWPDFNMVLMYSFQLILFINLGVFRFTYTSLICSYTQLILS